MFNYGAESPVRCRDGNSGHENSGPLVFFEDDGTQREPTKDEVQDWIIQPALDFANSIRHALAIGEGKLEELPKGQKSNAHSCVLARALSNGWTARVGYDQIILVHRLDDGVDFGKAVEAVEALGFQAYEEVAEELYDDLQESMGWEELEECHAVVIETPRLISSGFLPAFDSGLLPDLILNG